MVVMISLAAVDVSALPRNGVQMETAMPVVMPHAFAKLPATASIPALPAACDIWPPSVRLFLGGEGDGRGDGFWCVYWCCW